MDSTSAGAEQPNRALAALERAGIDHTVTRHGRVSSLEEAAAVRGIEPRDLVKTMVVRVAPDDHRFVLVPGDATIDWARLRAVVGVSRMTMADQATAHELTGYERGTITPFGSDTALPVIVDERMVGRKISIGHGGARCRGDRGGRRRHRPPGCDGGPDLVMTSPPTTRARAPNRLGHPTGSGDDTQRGATTPGEDWQRQFDGWRGQIQGLAGGDRDVRGQIQGLSG